jgi:pyruvate formate lyase activating enzyme
MGRCIICGRSGKTISDVIGVCVDCLRNRPYEALQIAMKAHIEYRKRLGLPPEPPRHSDGVKCNICVNECVIPPNGVGFCGVWKNDGGLLKPIEGFSTGILHYYLDPLPTNCVATPVCPAATGAGYPKYALVNGPEYGYYNLAIFFAGCNLDCLFCQNWEHKNMIVNSRLRIAYKVSEDDIVRVALYSKVPCVCYFGGDPGPHAIYALKVSRRIVEEAQRKGIIKRICWETNGVVNENIMKEMARISLVSGGIVKIDWKAWSPAVYQALTGIDGWKAVERVKRNVKLVAEMAKERKEIPLLVVSILLVPGYVDAEEVYHIAEYIASIDEETPLVLLAFYPTHLLRDLPPTSRRHAQQAFEAARKAGLKRVFIGNEWLLGEYY